MLSHVGHPQLFHRMILNKAAHAEHDEIRFALLPLVKKPLDGRQKVRSRDSRYSSSPASGTRLVSRISSRHNSKRDSLGGTRVSFSFTNFPVPVGHPFPAADEVIISADISRVI